MAGCWQRGLNGPQGQGQPPACCSFLEALGEGVWESQLWVGGLGQVCVQGTSGLCRDLVFHHQILRVWTRELVGGTSFFLLICFL